MATNISASTSTRRLLKRNINRIKDYVTDWSETNVSDSIERMELLVTELNSYSEQFNASIQVTFCNIDSTDPTEMKKIEHELFREQDEVKIEMAPLVQVGTQKGWGCRTLTIEHHTV